MTRNELEPLMTVEEVATYLNIAEKTVRNKVSLNQIPFVKVGGSVRFRRADIDRWIVEQPVVAARESA